MGGTLRKCKKCEKFWLKKGKYERKTCPYCKKKLNE